MIDIKNLDFRLPTAVEIFGDSEKNGQLDIIKKCGIYASASDYAIATGTRIACRNSKKQLRKSFYMTQTLEKDRVFSVGDFEFKIRFSQQYRNSGIRPVVPYSAIREFCSKERVGSFGEIEVTCYGFEIANSAAPFQLQSILEEKLCENNIDIVDKETLVNVSNINNSKNLYEESCEKIYTYEGNMYQRVIANFDCDSHTLFNGIVYRNNKVIWHIVDNPVLLVDKENDIAMFKQTIIGGIPFNLSNNNCYDYSNSFVNKFLKEKLPIILQPCSSDKIKQKIKSK